MSYCIVGASYVRLDAQPRVVLCLRDERGKRVKKSFPYLPYFFVREEDLVHFKGVIGLKTSNILGTQYGFTGVDGSKLCKITMKDPSDIGEINRSARDADLHLYESNVLFHYRFMLDKGLSTGLNAETLEPMKVESRHKIIFIDIEVKCNGKPRDYLFPVSIIGIYDPVKKQYHSIFTGKDFNVNLEVLKTEPREVVKYPCETEEQLFATFASVWFKLDADAVSSFSNFDMDYLVKRMSILGIDYKFLSPTFNVAWQRNLNIHCIHIIDYAQLYRKVFGEPVWETLDYISKKELGYGKFKEVDYVNTDYKEMVEYNLRDVELLKDLEDELGLIKDYLMLIWSETGLDLADCMIPNRIGDILHFRHIKSKYILKSESTEQGQKYSGALVLCDNVGLYHNVLVLDWNELYPTIMEDFHVSLDTYDPFGDIKIAEGMSFTSSKPGWTNEILKPSRKRRAEIKTLAKQATVKKEKRRWKMLSAAIKSIINAEYGLYGQKTKTFTSRFYDPKIAGAITYVGRDILVEAKAFLEKLGYILVYADTDSLFIILKTKDKEEIEKVRLIIETHVSEFIKTKYGISSKFRLDYEMIFESLLILTKKRYHGITTTGETVIKGLNIVRKDTSAITIREQETVGRMRLSGVPIEEISTYVEKLYDDVSHGRVKAEDIAVLGKCTKKHYDKITRNSKAIEYSRTKGIEIEVDQRFYWLYIYPRDSIKLTSKGKVKVVPANVIAFMDIKDIPPILVVDYKRMAEFTIRNPLKHYIEKEKDSNQVSLSKYWQ